MTSFLAWIIREENTKSERKMKNLSSICSIYELEHNPARRRAHSGGCLHEKKNINSATCQHQGGKPTNDVIYEGRAYPSFFFYFFFWKCKFTSVAVGEIKVVVWYQTWQARKSDKQKIQSKLNVTSKAERLEIGRAHGSWETRLAPFYAMNRKLVEEKWLSRKCRLRGRIWKETEPVLRI